MTASSPDYLTLPDGGRLAFHAVPARRADTAEPGVVFLGGFMSDMTGDKATSLHAWAVRSGRAFLRLDYSGHGQSDGAFRDGTIGRWVDDAHAVLAHCRGRVAGLDGGLVLVGSSMGAWVMIRLAQRLRAEGGRQRAAGLVGIAAAPDFTEDLLPHRLGAEAMTAIDRDGLIEMPTVYSDRPYTVTRRLLEEARDQLVLRGPIDLDLPVRLLHGIEDRDVPWTQSQTLMQALTGDDVTLTLVKGGDHRLSTPRDLARLAATVEALCDGIAAAGSEAGV
jgi:pimeloyl-ACP methyl ester carboxylesterase